MTFHDYASCDDPLCQVCEGYSAGYVDGKSKTLFEVSTSRLTMRPAAGVIHASP